MSVYIYSLNDDGTIRQSSVSINQNEDKEDTFFTRDPVTFQAIPNAKPIEQGQSGTWYFQGEVDEDTENQILVAELKEHLFRDNDDAAEAFRVSQPVSVKIGKKTLHFITDRETQADLQTALLAVNNGVKYPWVDEDGCSFTFTAPEQILTCLTAIMNKANIYDQWAAFKDKIEHTNTVAGLQQIKIEYKEVE